MSNSGRSKCLEFFLSLVVEVTAGFSTSMKFWVRRNSKFLRAGFFTICLFWILFVWWKFVVLWNWFWGCRDIIWIEGLLLPKDCCWVAIPSDAMFWEVLFVLWVVVMPVTC